MIGHRRAFHRPKVRTSERPWDFPNHATENDGTVELVHVSPETFLWLEGRKRPSRKPISLATVRFKGL